MIDFWTDMVLLFFLVIFCFVVAYFIFRPKNRFCNHLYEFIEKWQDGNTTYYEFYCRNCLEIMIRDYKNDDN